MKTRTIEQTVIFAASPHDVYELIMDEKKHAKFTDGKAKVSREIDGAFSAYDGWIFGKNVELVQDKKIVQTWAANDDEWPEGHESKVTFEFKKTKDGTELTFTHEKVPKEWYDDLCHGWIEHYWEPMKKALGKFFV